MAMSSANTNTNSSGGESRREEKGAMMRVGFVDAINKYLIIAKFEFGNMKKRATAAVEEGDACRQTQPGRENSEKILGQLSKCPLTVY